MRSVRYDYVLRGAAETAGRVYTNLLADEADLFRGFISRRLREAWESQFWPELMVIEERTVSSNDTFPYSATDKTDIGEVLRVTDADPRETYKLKTYDFNLTDAGVNIPNISTTATAFIEFRKRAPMLTGSTWASGTYTAGTQVYHSTEGDFFDTASSTSAEPPASPWVKLDIPWIFKAYLEWAAAADMLLLDEKPDLASIQKLQADEAIAREMAKIRQQSQHTNILIRTR